jgi:hypothetical protein
MNSPRSNAAKPSSTKGFVLVALVMRQFGNAVVDQLTRGFFDRGEIAGRDVRLDSCFLFGRQCYRHACIRSMLERRRPSTGCTA